MLALLLFALAVDPTRTPAPAPAPDLPVFVNDARRIFVANLVEAKASPWKETSPGLEARTVALQIDVEVLSKNTTRARPSHQVIRCEVPQSRWKSGIPWETPDLWSAYDLKAGESFLVFGDGKGSFETDFRQPLDLWRATGDRGLVSDVEFVVGGQGLPGEQQASRVLDLLKQGSEKHGVFIGRYLAALAVAIEGPSRGKLLDWTTRIGGNRLSDSGESELLRSFQMNLVLRDKPPADAVLAFAAACLHALASVRSENDNSITPLVESVVQVYLPWLAKHVSRFPSAVLPPVAKDQRVKLREAARSLAALERFSAESRDVLRQLANALQ